jgi:hypothetical protein
VAVFVGVGLMVFFGERFAKPMTEEDQNKYSKILPILVFILILGGLIRALV